jgi:hypothetical protein
MKFLSYALGTFLDIITIFHYKNDLIALKKTFHWFHSNIKKTFIGCLKFFMFRFVTTNCFYPLSVPYFVIKKITTTYI